MRKLISPNHIFCYKEDFFSEEDINDIHDIKAELEESDAQIFNQAEDVEDTTVRKTKVSFIKADEKEKYRWLFSKITECTQKVQEEFFPFDLRVIEDFQYSVYNEGDFYKCHTDTGHDYGHGFRKLSFVLHLTDGDEYEGGDLLLHTTDKPIVMPRKKGTIIYFPSYVLHEVTPVTKGVRKTLVGWLSGPAFV